MVDNGVLCLISRVEKLTGAAKLDVFFLVFYDLPVFIAQVEMA